MYKIEDINIGDEVIFNSTNSQSNHDLYWKVRGKSNNQIMIELTEMGFDEYWTISIEEIIGHIPLSKNRK
ncbi:hypothetical protein EZS27_012373 [termite gut metagenome]|jgi:hypothetical protein|uniref:Uncharacterized protein n=1 Tax=termite gut metagenome TaxID=433724 RepID=A0A5J4S0W7_9ZZZZ